MQQHKLTTPDGFILDADYHAGTTTRGVIFCHGAGSHKGNKELQPRIARALEQAGLHTLLFDFRAHGKSSGNSITDFLIAGELRDLSTAVAFMQAQGVTELGLVGASLGGAITSLYAGNNPASVQALALLYPVLDYHTSFFAPTTPESAAFFAAVHATLAQAESFTVPWNNFQFGRGIFVEMQSEPALDPMAALKQYHGPLLLVHGDSDTSIAHKDSVRHFAALPHANKRFVSIAGGEHSFETEPHQSEAVQEIVSFFTTTLVTV